ncbi:aldehyde dehydrogenase family protein [Gordonia terrae]|jgi:aldehyde dehydrogenase (NAD+)/betaine-aldehyde dehydrogenase|uniref:aldehyde dehydrogenase (NAD(+)) n=2 Tax=Gordonia terrae TaxID=2055 RepID=A0AAD0KAZ6_9ACTN|nr:aldehyde dehydrogenase family protein [Gordonia terrae]VTR08430.1 aldehyde dehydrogenase [Clostridioides difficile]ANY25492.1 aldehyde dehydrogenase [Gordonia terrae]AWO86240.1 aldehyde dehydrogenase family protein [Gordonia terrae]VTS63569.1 Putative aldehyde dehydrogenase SA1924 [Gordonia terrae]GAB43649.1 putative aldehyde dehydrogenase [Gordonia terrae NBRC 100016]
MTSTNEATTVEDRDELYIGGKWVPSVSEARIEVREAATGATLAHVPDGDTADCDDAVEAANVAFDSWSTVPVPERAAILRTFADELAAREDQLATMMTREVGTPIGRSRSVQVGLGVTVFRTMADALEAMPLEERRGNSRILRVPAGVVGAITPWNYPLYQLAAKVAPALAAGCTAVVKPSSVAPLAAFVVADIADAIGLPAGVLNVVSGPGRTVGQRLATNPGVDLVSLTGSTGAGAKVAELAATGIKKVTLELGGKSAFIVAPGADLDTALAAAVRGCFVNNGQTCAATTRLIVARDDIAAVEERLAELVGAMTVGDPLDPSNDVGPMASAAQQRVVLGFLDSLPNGARVLVGGPGEVPGLDDSLSGGYFVRPTVVSGVDNSADIAREEVFGPVLTVLEYSDVNEAVAIANDSDYGLSGAVFAADDDAAVSIARRLRTGQVAINGGRFNPMAPFGGMKKSGIGRELGPDGLEEYFEKISLQMPA